jgi:hypothetical protein
MIQSGIFVLVTFISGFIVGYAVAFIRHTEDDRL